MKIIKTRAKSIFTKTRLPGASYVINQYVGCQHGCLYCYAKFMCRWKNYGKWGDWVEAKINAPDLVKNKIVDGCVVMSSISDAYQPIEKKLELTRNILKNLNKNIELSILTKSNLVLRDIDILKKFKKVEVGITFNGFKGEIKKLFEPCSSAHDERLESLKILHENKLKTYGFISPIIPGLVDVKALVKESKNFTDSYWFEILNLRAAGSDFTSVLKKQFPKSYETMTNKEKFNRFVEEIKEIVKEENIKIEGIAIHYPNMEIIKC